MTARRTRTNAPPIREFIYRQGPDRAKSLSLHRPQDWATGLSFTDAPPPGGSMRFRASALRSAGYVVRPDQGQLVATLWDEQPVMDPATGVQALFPSGHVTVYHADRYYWEQWHRADLANKGSQRVSAQLDALYALREH